MNITSRTPQHDFIQALFLEFNMAGIMYAVMRNHELLPQSTGGGDLDLIIDSSSENHAQRIIVKVISSSGAVSLGTAKTSGFFKTYILGRNVNAFNSWWGLCIDINVGLLFKGQNLISHIHELPIRQHRGINVLSNDCAGVLGVLKEVLNNCVLPARYALASRNAADKNWTEIGNILAPMGISTLSHLKALILSANDDHIGLNNCRKIRNLFFRHAFRTHPYRFTKNRITYEFSKLHRYIVPAGTVIAILGTDGAGKSTIINAIKPALDDATHNAVFIQHLRPGLIPPLARLKGKITQIGAVKDPHGSASSGFLGSLFRLMYLTLDYVLGYWLKTRLKIAKQPAVVIFDRYAYDIIIDPRRFRIDLPISILRLFARIAPTPDIILCLHGNPASIADRKREVPVNEVERQVIALKLFAEREPRSVLISTDGTVEEARDQVLNAIYAYHANRLRK